MHEDTYPNYNRLPTALLQLKYNPDEAPRAFRSFLVMIWRTPPKPALSRFPNVL